MGIGTALRRSEVRCEVLNIFGSWRHEPWRSGIETQIYALRLSFYLQEAVGI